MPLFVKAVPKIKGEKNIYGPYPEKRLHNVVTYARMSSAKAKYRPRREVYWFCGAAGPMLIRVYEHGRRVYPPEEKGNGARQQYQAIRECLARTGGRCATVTTTPTEKSFKASRRLPARFVCPFPG